MSKPRHFGFEQFRLGAVVPVLLVYGAAMFAAVGRSGLGLFTYARVGLAAGGGGDAGALAVLFRKLKSRAVVILPEAVADGHARAVRHAALLAEAGVTAVGIIEELDGETSDDPRAYADAALRLALMRAMPAQGARPARAVVPWVGPLDAGAMFERARAVLARTLAEPPTTLDALVLWSLHTWCLRANSGAAFEVSPRLVLAANDARADHARALKLLSWLTPSPLIVSRTMAAHLVSVIETERPTLLLDDVAGGLFSRRDMRTLIAAGALREGLFLGARTKCDRTGRKACFAPAAIATTSLLPEDVRVRAIVAPMQPPPVGRARPPLGDVPGDILELRAQMQAFAARAAIDVAAADVPMPRLFGSAAREAWTPLIAIAAALGANVAGRAVAAAEALQCAEPAPASNLALLADVRALVPLGVRAGVTTGRMIEHLTGDAERPWASIRRGGKLDARALADRLRPFGVRPTTLRQDDGTFVRGYRARDLTEAFERYLSFRAITGDGAEAAA